MELSLLLKQIKTEAHRLNKAERIGLNIAYSRAWRARKDSR